MKTLTNIGLAIGALGLSLASVHWGFGLVAEAYEVWCSIAALILCQIGGGLLLVAALIEREARRLGGPIPAPSRSRRH